ncbi:hypothetical protein BJV77DRAFT_1131087 [Russula vinacea]|nr:hypothetical protein BJV77DRAFT_1131087 [Russula vinacea]
MRSFEFHLITPACHSRSSHLRGRVKSKIQPHIKNLYGFHPVSRPRAVEHNIRLARKLKEKFTFLYAERGEDGNKGLYEHPIIQQTINAVWFNGKKDDGIMLTDIYRPFPKVALALTLTAIENCIDEWADGTHTSITFSQDSYEDLFKEHLQELDNFDKFTKSLNMLPMLLWGLYNEGRHSAGVDPSEQSRRVQSPSAYVAAMEEFRNRECRLANLDLADPPLSD